VGDGEERGEEEEARASEEGESEDVFCRARERTILMLPSWQEGRDNIVYN
jgi:hypothetical protein